MLTLQVVPQSGIDAYRLLRNKVTREARTWYWKNKDKTRLMHKNKRKGFIEIGRADGILVAEIHAATVSDDYFFAEKLIGRLVAWFESDLAAINIQFRNAAVVQRKRRKKKK